MVAMKNCNSFGISSQIVCYSLTDDKQGIEGWYFMIFPIVAYDILQHFFINGSAADVDCEVFILVVFIEKLGDCINGVPV